MGCVCKLDISSLSIPFASPGRFRNLGSKAQEVCTDEDLEHMNFLHPRNGRNR